MGFLDPVESGSGGGGFLVPLSTNKNASLESRALELETLQREFGAPEVPQDRPGVFRTLLDILSRPNFAIAGLSEELLNETPSVTRGVKRALTEIFSGVGDIKGEKRAFGEVLENLGVGTTTLADAFPALESTWVGKFGSRGAAGIALDIATDPLTYMTFGASGGLRIATSKGTRFLNQAGKEARLPLFKKNLDLARSAIPGTDDVAKGRQFTRALLDTDKEFESLFSKAGDIDPQFLEPGGAKIFGAQIPGTADMGKPLRAALGMLPESITKPVVEGATLMGEGMRKTLRGWFSPDGPLANLPEPLRARATALTNNFFRSSTAHRAMLYQEMKPLERIYRGLEKADPKIGERWYDVREGIRPITDITKPEELDAFNKTMALYESMGSTLLEHGVLTNAQILPNYIYHTYKNVEDLAQYHPRPGVNIPKGSKARFEKERKFENYRFAEEESKARHEVALRLMSRGEAERLYPVLEPEFDVFKNMESYINDHASVLARKAWREEMTAEFGKTGKQLLDEFDYDALYDDIKIKPKDTPGAPKEFTPENVPLRRAVADGDVETAVEKLFGPEGASYVGVKSKFTDDEFVYMPRAVADALETINSSVFNTKDFKEFGKMVKNFDWVNNNFKWGVYTIWPASATRDAYSNIALAMLRIGIAALDPGRHIAAIRLMAGRDLGRQFARSGHTVGELRELSKTLGVWVPGQVFVEQTGRFKLGRARRALTEARAGIENEARVMLWLEEIRRGADPRTAADTVGEFLFNYGEVSRVERDIFRRLIPFYTFTRKNIERQWKTLRANPGMQVNQLKPFRGRQEENEQMVQWKAEGLKMRMDKDGKTVHMITGIDLPLRNLDTIWRGDLQRTGRSIMGMVTPVIKVIPEVLLNQDFFLGRDLTRTQSNAVGKMIDVLPTPDGVKDWMGYKKETDSAGRPKYTFDGRKFTLLFRSWMLSRAVSTSDRQFRDNMDNGGAQWQRMMLDVLTGLRMEDVDLDEQMRRRRLNRIRQLRESLAARGVLPTFQVAGSPRVEGAEFR